MRAYRKNATGFETLKVLGRLIIYVGSRSALMLRSALKRSQRDERAAGTERDASSASSSRLANASLSIQFCPWH